MLHAMALRVFGALPRAARTRVIRLLYPTYTAGVGVAVVDPAGRLLLVTHSYSKGWGLPGGLMGKGEAAGATAVRELREELGLAVSLEGHGIAVQTPGRRHFNFLFDAAVDAATAASIEPHSPEITGTGFFELDALPELAEFTDLFLEALGLVSPARG